MVFLLKCDLYDLFTARPPSGLQRIFKYHILIWGEKMGAQAPISFLFRLIAGHGAGEKSACFAQSGMPSARRTKAVRVAPERTGSVSG